MLKTDLLQLRNEPIYSCRSCDHFFMQAGRRSCHAFPNGIPDTLFKVGIHHEKILFLQQGEFTFQPNKALFELIIRRFRIRERRNRKKLFENRIKDAEKKRIAIERGLIVTYDPPRYLGLCVQCDHYLGDHKCKAFDKVLNEGGTGFEHYFVLEGQLSPLVFKPDEFLMKRLLRMERSDYRRYIRDSYPEFYRFFSPDISGRYQLFSPSKIRMLTWYCQLLFKTFL